MALVAAVLLLGALGCSSKASNAGPSETTVTTQDPGPTIYVAPLPDPPITRAPDPVAFCTDFGNLQDLSNSVPSMDFDTGGLALLAAPQQFMDAARALQTTAPDEIVDGVNSYAAAVKISANKLAAVTTGEQIFQIAGDLSVAPNSDDMKPVRTWIIAGCAAPIVTN